MLSKIEWIHISRFIVSKPARQKTPEAFYLTSKPKPLIKESHRKKKNVIADIIHVVGKKKKISLKGTTEFTTLNEKAGIY